MNVAQEQGCHVACKHCQSIFELPLVTAGASGRTVAAVIVTPKAAVPKSKTEALDAQDQELLKSLVEMPGMEEAVKARVSLLFPQKEKPALPLQRSNSI